MKVQSSMEKHSRDISQSCHMFFCDMRMNFFGLIFIKLFVARILFIRLSWEIIVTSYMGKYRDIPILIILLSLNKRFAKEFNLTIIFSADITWNNFCVFCTRSKNSSSKLDYFTMLTYTLLLFEFKIRIGLLQRLTFEKIFPRFLCVLYRFLSEQACKKEKELKDRFNRANRFETQKEMIFPSAFLFSSLSAILYITSILIYTETRSRGTRWRWSVFLAPANTTSSTSRRRAYTPGMRQVNYTRCVELRACGYIRTSDSIQSKIMNSVRAEPFSDTWHYTWKSPFSILIGARRKN